MSAPEIDLHALGLDAATTVSDALRVALECLPIILDDEPTTAEAILLSCYAALYQREMHYEEQLITRGAQHRELLETLKGIAESLNSIAAQSDGESSETATLEKARELGIEARPGESWEDLRHRIQSAMGG